MELTSYAAIVVITAALRVAAQTAPDLPDDFQASSESASSVEISPGVTPAQAPQLESPEEVVSDPIEITMISQASSGPVATLYTSDGSFRCGGCEQQERILSTANISSDLYSVQRVSADVAAAMGGVPRWEPYDKSRMFPGVMQGERLQVWLESLQSYRDQNTPAQCSISGMPVASVQAVAAALSVHLSEEDHTQRFESLLKIDVDTPDSVNSLVFDLLASGQWTYEPAGLAFDWSGASRTITTAGQKITLNPPAKITLTKWRAKWTAALNAVQYDTATKTVTLELSGAPDLTVSFR